jgi:hypothetical protein
MADCKFVFTDVIDYSEKVACVSPCSQTHKSREGHPFGVGIYLHVS